jgi:hypothetical protein
VTGVCECDSNTYKSVYLEHPCKYERLSVRLVVNIKVRKIWKYSLYWKYFVLYSKLVCETTAVHQGDYSQAQPVDYFRDLGSSGECMNLRVLIGSTSSDKNGHKILCTGSQMM